jgi:hypothetical protein
MRHDKEDLSAYLDGALSAPDRGRVEAHLKDCAECRAQLDALRSVSGRVKELSRQPLPRGFLQRLEARRRTAGAAGWSVLWSPRGLAWAACVVTIMFVVSESLRLNAPPPPAASDQAPSAPVPAVPPAAGRPVSTEDLVALAKEQQRAAGLAAMAETAADSGMPAKGLPAPASPKSLGGRALDEKPAAGGGFTNDDQQRKLAAERARLGIQRIIIPHPVLRGMRAAAEAVIPGAKRDLEKEDVPARINGTKASLLSAPQSGGRSPADGALVPPEDFSGGAPPRKMKSPGAPLPSAAPQEAGQPVYSNAEMALVWRERGLEEAPPAVDFSSGMLVVLFGQARIESASEEGDRVVVRFRTLRSVPRPGERWRVIPRSGLPVIFVPEP